MTSPSPFDENGLQYAWNSTSIKLSQECLYKYKLIMLDGWQSPTLSLHLRFGLHYASALEEFHKAMALGVPRDEALIDIIADTMVVTWDYEKCETCEGTGRALIMRCEGGQPYQREDDCPDCNGTGDVPGSGTAWETDDSAKNRPNLIRSIIWYLDHFEDDNTKTIILADGSAAVEHSLIVPVDNDLLFTGHLDRLVDYAHNIYVQDQKTTKTTISQRYFEGYSPDTQMSIYTFMAKAALSIPVHGVMIDAAQIAVGFTRFERGFTFRSPTQLNEWYDNTMLDIERARAATREKHFPMNPTACGNYGGCMFRRACSRSPEVRSQFLKADYIQGSPMNPLEIR